MAIISLQRFGFNAAFAMLAVVVISVAAPMPSGAVVKPVKAKSHKAQAAHGKRVAKYKAPLSRIGYGSNSTANPTGAATTGATSK